MSSELILPSTLFLTLLLGIGLFFFLRASTKNRTETLTIPASEPPEVLLNKIQAHLTARSYLVTAVDAPGQAITFAGLVGASWGLAAFLTALAVLGLGSLGLVLGMLWSPLEGWGLGLVIFAPLATRFYWAGAQRQESVLVQLESPPELGQSRIKITAHRDELIALSPILQAPIDTHP